MKESKLPYYFLVSALFFGIISPDIFSDGMFMDGVTYAVISKNLANGLGGIWDLHYTSTLFPHFHEHPPLVFYFQSLLFRLLGDSILIERIYSLFTFIITSFLIHFTWKIIAGKENRDLSWLPLLFWILVPIVCWAASNNLLENTLMIFTGLSVLFILKSLSGYRFLYLVLAGIMLFLGWMSKGFVAFFPLSLPLWIYLFKPGGPYKRFFLDTIVLISATLLPFLFLFLVMPESIQSLHAYIDQQVFDSIQNVKTVWSRFYILARLLFELILGLLLILLVFFASRKFQAPPSNRRWSYVFIALGLSGVVPIMISLKQSGFYILPTYSFFSIALAFIILPRVKFLVDKFSSCRRSFVLFKPISIILLTFSIIITFSHYGSVGMDEETVEDVNLLREIIPQGSTISISDSIWENWSLHAYFHRYGEISLDRKKPSSMVYLLLEKESGNEPPDCYKKQAVLLNQYVLYKK